MTENINRPSHYIAHGVPVLVEPGSTVAGLNDYCTAIGTVECHDVIDALGLHQDGDVQQAFQYLWRAFRKGNSPYEHVAKAHKCLSMSLRRRGVLS